MNTFRSFLLLACLAAPTAHAASYCVFQQLERGVPSTVNIYDINDTPCVVTKEDGRNVRLEEEAVDKRRYPVACRQDRICTKRTDYSVGRNRVPFVVIFQANHG